MDVTTILRKLYKKKRVHALEEREGEYCTYKLVIAQRVFRKKTPKHE